MIKKVLFEAQDQEQLLKVIKEARERVVKIEEECQILRLCLGMDMCCLAEKSKINDELKQDISQFQKDTLENMFKELIKKLEANNGSC